MAVITLQTNGVNFVNKDNGRGIFVSDAEQLADELRAFTEVFLNKLTTDDAEKSGARLTSNSLGEEGLSYVISSSGGNRLKSNDNRRQYE